MRKSLTILFGAAALLPWGLHAQSSVPNELLVQFKASATAAEKGRALGRGRAQVQEEIIPAGRRRDGRGDLVLVKHPDGPPGQAKREIEGDSAVEFAEPNWIYSHYADASDPKYLDGSLWGLNGTYGSQAAKAWAAGYTGSTGVVVGVIDEGIQYNHTDLTGQVRNPLEYGSPAGDSDGNGFIDDVYGWDFAGNDSSVYDGGTKGNLDDHGTHVAGTIGASANGLGVVGMSWNVTMISAKFLGRTGGTTANAVKALYYLIGLKAKGLNIVATNNSWGGGGYSQVLFDAIQASGAAGMLFVAAAGNGNAKGIGQNNDATPHYPSSYNLDNIIAVGAISSDGKKATYSNYGATTVDLFAPGSGILSTTAYNTLTSYSGTSMATPHVTGAVALYAAAKGLSPQDLDQAKAIKAAILNNVDKTAPSLAGLCLSGGRLNIYKAITQ